MRPHVAPHNSSETLGLITVLIIEKDPETATALFRHIIRQSPDPRQRYERALKFLSGEYYESPEYFSDVMTAQFSQNANSADALLKAGRCVLTFEQHEKWYRLSCAVDERSETDPVYQATCWHNHLFNPTPPPRVRVLSFAPDWESAAASTEG